ncbi:putative amidohydrolase [Archaeoglobus sulfaticallidus PM70-1]|uniref:Putative amidohydrolase n=1 Tax=Archaeoglobus sulfaticallidus PM70-1 TaxID=387631 RepID=N0BDH3_9EURY|nr:carbon-nitrogen family hydrolase [Archaeoglobus sulfaticallidus]AGK61684.1 putative amidohydrolase [Archaeoglobus sulfaticallidus PM70-1]
MREMNMISAIGQLRISPDRDVNLMKALSLIKRAIQVNAKLVVLPELFNTGFYPKNYELVEDNIEDEIDLILKLSERRDITIVGSVAEKENGKLYNSAVVIHRGEILGKYRKTHLFPLTEERKYFSTGNELKVVDTPVGKIGLMICYEVRFPEIARYLVRKGAEILAIPAEFPKERINHWKILLKARAIENQCFVFGANCAEGEDAYPGSSMIVDPWGNVLVEGGDRQEIIMAEIDIGEVEKTRRKFPFLRDFRNDLFSGL